MRTGDHVVQFYEHESELTDSVGRYLSDAVQAGAVAIVIATEAHRRAFAAELQLAGIDPAPACREGTLILLDAATTLASFMPEGRIDSVAFRAVVGSIVRRAGASGRPVRAYGEMVALLWDAGDVLGAIELEKLWNELGRELAFALLCGYHLDVCPGGRARGGVAGGLPSSLLGGARATRATILLRGIQRASPRSPPISPPSGNAPRLARHFVADALGRWGHANGVLDDAQLLVTELATNAVVHARSAVLGRGPPRRVRGPRLSPRRQSRQAEAPRGQPDSTFLAHGLRLVAALSADWGVDVTEDGKTVWAQLQR